MYIPLIGSSFGVRSASGQKKGRETEGGRLVFLKTKPATATKKQGGWEINSNGHDEEGKVRRGKVIGTLKSGVCKVGMEDREE
ncbi:MAG: hypothetical protein M1833_005937 [Piccolia ochrophora]|nr:MAG: hypothetical protein M1833_005937 [Piccolia ochrophora]